MLLINWYCRNCLRRRKPRWQKTNPQNAQRLNDRRLGSVRSNLLHSPPRRLNAIRHADAMERIADNMKARHFVHDLLHRDYSLQVAGFILRHRAVPAESPSKNWLAADAQNVFQFLLRHHCKIIIAVAEKIRQSRTGEKAAQ